MQLIGKMVYKYVCIWNPKPQFMSGLPERVEDIFIDSWFCQIGLIH